MLVFPTPGLRLLEEVVVDDEDELEEELLDEEELELLEDELEELEDDEEELELLDEEELELDDVLGSVEDGAVDEGLVTRLLPTNSSNEIGLSLISFFGSATAASSRLIA